MYKHAETDQSSVPQSSLAPEGSNFPEARKPPSAEARNAQDKTLLCKFFLKSRCSRKECNFAHSEAEQREACKKLPCRFNIDGTGTCRQGANCWYRHADAESGEQKETEAKDGTSMEMASEKNLSTPDATTARPRALSGLSGDATMARPRTFSGLSGDQDKTVMCKFWQKKRCDRKDCKFAHGEAEQRAACKMERCRYEKRGGCRQGAACWYLHTGDGKVSQYSTPKKGPASPPTSITLTPSSPASSSPFRQRFESWADCSDSDDDFCPRGHLIEGFPTLVTA